MSYHAKPKAALSLEFLNHLDATQLSGSGSAHAARLLRSLGVSQLPSEAMTDDSDSHHIAWARSGAMSLTGEAGGPPRLISAPLALAAQGAFSALRLLSPALHSNFEQRFEPGFDAARLLSERAAITGYQRQGSQSPGGSCRLLTTADGCIAINLARDDDWEQLPALLSQRPPQNPIVANDWDALAENLSRQASADVLALAQLLGLAAADATKSPPERPWCRLLQSGRKQAPPTHPPLVIDLSVLWAGPLCASLLGFAGARVLKVESSQRPDGARHGPAAFFDLMNGNKESLSLDLQSAAGRKQLAKLLQQADIVIESSRPRALRQMGIMAESFIRAKPGMVWLSITGYGRDDDNALRIAYGDDAGVAAGLSQSLFEQYGKYLFCGDAIADPLTGLHAAVAATAAWYSGSGCLLDVSLQAVTQFSAMPQHPVNLEVEPTRTGWCINAGGKSVAVLPPLSRAVTDKAQTLGADNQKLHREFSLL